MRARIPDSRLVLVDGGHLFPPTQPRQLVAPVDTFLATKG